MVGIDTLVWFVLGGLVAIAVISLLWWVITYCEKEIPAPPMVWKIFRVAFVILVVFFLIAVLLHLLGYPLVRF